MDRTYPRSLRTDDWEMCICSGHYSQFRPESTYRRADALEEVAPVAWPLDRQAQDTERVIPTRPIFFESSPGQSCRQGRHLL